MRVLQPNWTSGTVSLSQAALDCLGRSANSGDIAATLASVSKDGSFGWLAQDSALEVFRTSTGERVAAWCFGAVIKDVGTSITCVTEFCYENSTKLLVATSTPSTDTGLICVFDVGTSKIIKAIEVPYRVTALEVISSVGADHAPVQVLSEQLRCFCGVLAVGTHHGHIFLLDLCLDEEADSSDELRPNSVAFLDPRTRDVTGRRYNALCKRKHLCLELDEESHSRGYFYFRKPDSSVIKTFSSEDVCISSLSFTTQIGTLAVGFSFGCFQLWRLYIPVLEYSSRLEEDLPPVMKFAYMEPENDPRNFCYMWVARGPLPGDAYDAYCSSVMLFQLNFTRKVWYEGLGHVYEELTQVGPRFDHALTTDPYNQCADEQGGSRLVACYTIQDHNFELPEKNAQDDSYGEEGGFGPDLSLCVFVWEAAPAVHSNSSYYLALFDMNRWYHAQMPYSIRIYGDTHGMCSFFVFYSLQNVVDQGDIDSLVGLHIGYPTVSRFLSPVLPAPEQHFYPSALAFEGTCVLDGGIVHAKFLGLQRQILADIQKAGPGGLVDPVDMYNMCVLAGLLPRSVDISTSALTPLNMKREALLSTMLEHDMLAYISTCVEHWATGEFSSSGCNLRFLLDWAWSKVGTIKHSMDKLCLPLYDWSGMQLDQQSLQTLAHHQTCLQHIVAVLQTLSTHSASTTLQGRRDLEMKLNVVSLINQHLQVALWFYAEGLLPEHSEEEILGENQYCFPADVLTQEFNKRRQELKKLHREIDSSEVLLVDGLMKQIGEPLVNLWEKEKGSGMYPPPSLHALLNMYLLDGPLLPKQMIVFYLLYDLVSLAPEENTERFSEKLLHFSQAFSVPLSVVRLVQGLWLLDHKEFDDCLLYLLDPLVKSDMAPWQHTRIIKSFLYQGKNQMALKYMRIKKPPLLTPEDVKLRLTVLLANGLTAEAFEYQRVCRDQVNAEDLLSHLFLGCQQTKTTDQLLQLSMNPDEERHLVDYLKSSKEANSEELLVMHHLQRARFIEAIRLNARLKQNIMGDHDTAAKERAYARNSIIDSYHSVLPPVQRKLMFRPDQANRRSTMSRREIARPTPLSAVVNRARKSQIVTHATFISSVMDGVNDVQDMDEELPPHLSPRNTLRPASPGPFVCTPMTPRTQSRFRQSSEVVFPSTSAGPMMDRLGPLAASPAKRPYFSPLTQVEKFRQAETGKRRSSHYFSAEVLSLLATPPVRRKMPCKEPAPSSLPHTPQSILKVRHRAALRNSPTREVPNTKAVADLRLPTPPRFSRKNKSIAVEVEPEPEPVSESEPEEELIGEEPPLSAVPPALLATGTGSLPGTPKQLRFSVPPSEESTPEVTPQGSTPSPTESPESPSVSPGSILSGLARRSIRDRSPTPEKIPHRLSPKFYNVSPQHPAQSVIEEEMDTSQPQESIVVDEEVTLQLDKPKLDYQQNEPMEMENDTEPYEVPAPVLHQPSQPEYEEEDKESDIILLDEEEDQDDEYEESLEDLEVEENGPQDIEEDIQENHELEYIENDLEAVVEIETESKENEIEEFQNDEEEDLNEIESKENEIEEFQNDEEEDLNEISGEEDEDQEDELVNENDFSTEESFVDEGEQAVIDQNVEKVIEAEHSEYAEQNVEKVIESEHSEYADTGMAENQPITEAASPHLELAVSSDDSEIEVEVEQEIHAVVEVIATAEEVEIHEPDSTDPVHVVDEAGDNGISSTVEDGMDRTVSSTVAVTVSVESVTVSKELRIDTGESSNNTDADRRPEQLSPVVSTSSRTSDGSPVRRSPRISLKDSSPHQGHHCTLPGCQEQSPTFKTPPRPSRIVTMPPTPPESGKGTPPHEVSQVSPKASTVHVESPTSSVLQDFPKVSTPTRLSRKQTRSTPKKSTSTRSTRHSTAISEKTETLADVKETLEVSKPRTRGSSASPTATSESKVHTVSETEEVSKPRTRRSSLSRALSPGKEPVDIDNQAPSRPRTRRSSLPRSRTPEPNEELPGESLEVPKRTTRKTSKSRSATPETVMQTRTRSGSRSRSVTPEVAMDTGQHSPVRLTRGAVAKMAGTPVKPGTPVKEQPTTPVKAPKSPSRSTRASTPPRATTPTRATRSTQPVVDVDVAMTEIGTPKRRGRSSRNVTPSKDTTPVQKVTPKKNVTPSKATPAKKETPAKKVTPKGTTPSKTGKASEEKTVGRKTKKSPALPDVSEDHGRNEEDKREHGPLSSSSFMMRLRRSSLGRTGSQELRDPTPESTVPSEVTSVATDEDIAERMNFTFSDPMEINTDNPFAAPEESGPTVKPFIFSPPLTRSRRRQSMDLSKVPNDSFNVSLLPPPPEFEDSIIHSTKVGVSVNNINTAETDDVPTFGIATGFSIPVVHTSDPAQDTRPPPKKTAKRPKRRKQMYNPPTDSPISLLTPPTTEEIETLKKQESKRLSRNLLRTKPVKKKTRKLRLK